MFGHHLLPLGRHEVMHFPRCGAMLEQTICPALVTPFRFRFPLDAETTISIVCFMIPSSIISRRMLSTLDSIGASTTAFRTRSTTASFFASPFKVVSSTVSMAYCKINMMLSGDTVTRDILFLNSICTVSNEIDITIWYVLIKNIVKK